MTRNKAGDCVWSAVYAKPSFYYSYQHIRPGNIEKDEPLVPPRGATHSAEIEYVLGNFDVNKLYRRQQEDYKVSKIMQQYFADFIKFGDPNSENLPLWPLFAENKGYVIPKVSGMTYPL